MSNDFETMRPGEYHDPSNPAGEALVNQQLANGINPDTGQQTKLNILAIGKKYRWTGTGWPGRNPGDLVNPYTGAVVGNAFDLGIVGVSALPDAFDWQSAWDEISQLAEAKGYTTEAQGRVGNTYAPYLGAKIPGTDELVRRGAAAASEAKAIIAGLPLALDQLRTSQGLPGASAAAPAPATPAAIVTAPPAAVRVAAGQGISATQPLSNISPVPAASAAVGAPVNPTPVFTQGAILPESFVPSAITPLPAPAAETGAQPATMRAADATVPAAIQQEVTEKKSTRNTLLIAGVIVLAGVALWFVGHRHGGTP